MSTRDELIKEAATNAAQRVDAESVGIDPITVITIFSQILPLLISCGKRNIEPEPADFQAAIKRHCATPAGKAALRRKTMRRVRSEADERLTKEQAFAMADALIEEALNQNPRAVEAVCAVVSDAEFGS